MSAEITKAHHELINLIINNSKYPLDWILGLGMCEFYTHVQFIEKEIKQRAKNGK